MDPLRQIQGSEIFLNNLFLSKSNNNNYDNMLDNYGSNRSTSSRDGFNDGSENNNVKKRNRISFVCQACRRSKTKCDREKPRCGRCTQHGISCIYDVEKQPAPRNPSKDATIARLEKDVEYWRRKALKSMQEEEEIKMEQLEQNSIYGVCPSRSLKRALSVSADSGSSRNGIGNDDSNSTPTFKISRPSFSSSSRSSKSASTSSVHSPKDQIRINLYKSHPSMIINRASKREVKPLSENYVITRDMFLSGLLSSVFLDDSNHTMLPALSASAAVSKAQPSVTKNMNELKNVLANHCYTPLQLRRLHEFTDRILNNVNPKKVLPMGKMGLMLQSAFERHYLENYSPPHTEYSDTLKSFIGEMEEVLPPYSVIQRYKSHFYRSIFPNAPFLNVKSFESSLESTLFPHEADPHKVVIRLGNIDLRHKMENLCILLLILKLSYVSLQVMDEGPQKLSSHQKENLEKHPIGNQSVTLAQRVLAAENFFSRANENIITCLLYIWFFFVYSPEESDFFLEHPTDLILGMILPLSMSIALHRDPSDFPQLQDPSMNEPSVVNHRRILWVSAATAICMETSLKGRHLVTPGYLMHHFIDIKDPNVLQIYMERVKNDMPTNSSLESLNHHEFCFKRLLLSFLILELDNITLTYNGTFSLDSIEEARDKIIYFLDDNFPMPNLNGNTPETKERFNVFVKSNTLPIRIIGFLMILRSSLALFLHFESLLPEKPEYMPQYQKYFNLVCSDSLNLILHPRCFFLNTHKFKTSPAESYSTTKCIQLELSTSFFAILAILMRVDLANRMLLSQYQEDGSNVDSGSTRTNNLKLEIMGNLKRTLEHVIENIHNTASVHLRFTYFSVFKMLALFDVIVVRMKKGELWNGVFKIKDLGDFNTALLKALNTRLCLDPDNKQNILEKLKQRTCIIDFSISDLTSLYQGIKKKYDHLPLVCTPADHGADASDTPLRTVFKLYDGNNSKGNLDRLSSAAALGHNFNFGTFHDPSQSDPRVKTELPDFATVATPDLGLSDENYATVSRDFPGLFGGFDLFNYDFLFGNDF